MKNILTFLFLIIYASFIHAQNGWFLQYPLNSSDQLLNIQFLNLNTGYVTGQNSIFKTINGGDNWIDITSTSGYGYYAIHFLNVNTGYIGGRYSSTNGRILKTTNGGQNWIVQQTGVYDQEVFTIYAIDENTVIIGENTSSTSGQIFKSTNGGTNWISVYFNAYKGIQCIKFVNNLTGYACGTSFWKSTDAGNSWNEKTTIPYSTIHYGLCFLNENTGYSVGINSVAKTTDSGDNWVAQTPNVNTYFVSVSFINVNTGMVIGDNGTILRTTNGGMNWLNISRPEFNYLGGIQMLNSDTVYCAGWLYFSTNRSLVIKSFTGGLTKIINTSSITPSEFRLEQNFPNPFNPTTKIKFSIPPFEGGQGGMIVLKVYDVLGKEISTLVNEKLQPGTYEVPFSINQFSDYQLPTGVYFYRLITDGYSETKKMVLLK